MSEPLQPAAALADVLSAEVAVLEALHFRVVQAANLAAAGRHRFLAPAADEVLDAIDELAGLELARALVVSDAVAAWGLADHDQPTLAELAAAAPRPWPPVLAGFAARMRQLAAAIDEAAGRGAGFAARGRARVRAALAAVDDAAGYEPDGSPVAGLVT